MTMILIISGWLAGSTAFGVLVGRAIRDTTRAAAPAPASLDDLLDVAEAAGFAIQPEDLADLALCTTYADYLQLQDGGRS